MKREDKETFEDQMKEIHTIQENMDRSILDIRNKRNELVDNLKKISQRSWHEESNNMTLKLGSL